MTPARKGHPREQASDFLAKDFPRLISFLREPLGQCANIVDYITYQIWSSRKSAPGDLTMVVVKREFVIAGFSCSSSLFWKILLRRLFGRETNLHYVRRIRLRHRLLRLFFISGSQRKGLLILVTCCNSPLC